MGPYIQDFFSFDSIFLPVQEVPDPGVQAIRVIGDGPPRGPGIGGEKGRIFGDVDFRVHTAHPIRGRARPGENGRNFNLRSNFIGGSVIFSLTVPTASGRDERPCGDLVNHILLPITL